MKVAGEWEGAGPTLHVAGEGGDETPAVPSLAAGAIARGLSDAGESYRRGLLAKLLDTGPWDD